MMLILKCEHELLLAWWFGNIFGKSGAVDIYSSLTCSFRDLKNCISSPPIPTQDHGLELMNRGTENTYPVIEFNIGLDKIMMENGG
jgi:hypothetical protein